MVITWAAFVTAAAQILFLVNFFWSLWKGRRAGDNPWEATTLEWSIPSPPPFDNFGHLEPVVHHGPFEFSVPGAAKDYVMQTDPPSAVHAKP
jgi:cytochrome c oxidase subunit 1